MEAVPTVDLKKRFANRKLFLHNTKQSLDIPAGSSPHVGGEHPITLGAKRHAAVTRNEIPVSHKQLKTSYLTFRNSRSSREKKSAKWWKKGSKVIHQAG